MYNCICTYSCMTSKNGIFKYYVLIEFEICKTLNLNFFKHNYYYYEPDEKCSNYKIKT